MKRIWSFTTFLILTACVAAEPPTPSPSLSSTATLTPSAMPIPTATPAPSNTPPPTNTPTSQPTSSDCDVGIVLFSAHAVSGSKKPLDGLYTACADGSFFHQILSLESMALPDTTYIYLAFALSPSGEQVAISTVDAPGDSTDGLRGEIIIFDLADNLIHKVYEADYLMQELAWSADGEYLLYFTAGDSYAEIEVLHIDTSTTSRITDSGWLPIERFEDYHLHDLDWLPNSEQIYYSADTYDGSEYADNWQLIDISCDPQTHLCKPVDNHELGWIPDLTYTLSWLQDGSGILSIHYYRIDPEEAIYTHVIAFRSSDGTILREIELEGYSPPKGYGGVRDAVLSPDGKRIAFIAAIEGDWRTSLGEVLILSLEDMSITNLTEDPMFDDVGPGEVYWLPY